MKTVIVDLKTGALVSAYEGSPRQHDYGGPWGRPEETAHVRIPDGLIQDISALVADINDKHEVTIVEDTEKKAAVLAAQQKATIMAAIAKQQAVCDTIFNEFKYENSILGIRQEGKKEEVLNKMTDVMTALKTGDCELLIKAMQSIPTDQYDGKYLTEERLLKYKNMVEEALGLPKTSEL